MSAVSLGGRLNLDQARLERIADGLIVAVAVALPWSTSVTLILMGLWLIAIVPTLRWAEVRRELLTPAGGLPVLLVLLGIIGMAWADVPLNARWHGLDSFIKLLAIPLLFVQFRRSERVMPIFIGYVVSCIALMLVSYGMELWPHPVRLFSFDYGVPVKNAASQSGEFATCILGLLFVVRESLLRRQWLWLAGLVAVILAMLANMAFVATGRTALVVILVVLVLFALKMLSARGMALLLAAVLVVGLAAWFSSPYLRKRTETVWTDFQAYQTKDSANSSGERMEFYKKSVGFIREAPIFGHGTGTIPSLFARTVVGKTGAAGSPTTNPHNQTFAVAIQIGLVGVVVLWAMWIAHLLLFRGNSLIEWVGFVIVVQNIVGSLFNSHLFDFLQGWVYVIGLGVTGGAVLRRALAERAQAS